MENPLDYEAFANNYPVMQWERGYIIDASVDRLTRTWDRQGKILIPGYGRGGTMADLRLRWFGNYFGIDLNLAALKSGRLENRLVQGDINKMPFQKDSFDYAVIEDVFQDFGSFDKLVDALKSVAAVVKNKGQILLVNPTAESYTVETKMFDCSVFPENINAARLGMGREVRGKMKTVSPGGERIEFDFIDHTWRDKDLEKAIKLAGLRRLAKERPKARDDSKLPEWLGVHDWISETKTAPWVIYLLEVDK